MSKGYASNGRVATLAIIVLLVFGGIGSRLVWLQDIARDRWVGNVEKARRELIPSFARRGDIFAANGSLLATSRSVIVLGVDPQSERPEDRKKWPELAELTGLPLAQLQILLTTKYRAVVKGPAKPGGLTIGFNAVPQADAVSASSAPPPAAATAALAPGDPGDDESDAVLDDADSEGRRPIRWLKLCEGLPPSLYDRIVKLGVRGVYGQRVYRRAYPHNELAAHVIGYVDKDEKPAAGIEAYANFYLRGQNGWVESEKDGHQQELAQFRTREAPATDGYRVTLSIDTMVQDIVETELKAIAAKYQPQKATIIVSDPHTGFILALANYPTFNLNEYNKIPAAEQRNLRDAAVADMYEPGSVFKVVTVSGALNDHVVTPATQFDCNLEKAMVDGVLRRLPAENVGDHFGKSTSVADIIAASSNKGAAQIGILLGRQRLYDWARAFGFGQLTGFPFGGETPGALLRPAHWDGLTITRLPMGQSVDVTAIQIHQMMSVIANGGVLLRPQIIRQIRNASGDVVYRFGPAERRRVITEETAHVMAHLLYRVVNSEVGTGSKAAIPGFEVAGKTGTAQKVIDGHYAKHDHVTSFVGFLPATNPQVVISVIIDDPDAHTTGGLPTGGFVAAPSFKRVAEALISYLDIRRPVPDFARGTLALEGGRR